MYTSVFSTSYSSLKYIYELESTRGKERYFDLLFLGCFKAFYMQTLHGAFL